MPIHEEEGLSSSSTLDVLRSRDPSLDATKDSFHNHPDVRYSDDDTDTEIDNPLGSHLLGNDGSVIYHSQPAERRKWWKIYALHFLFMWNVRTYEYASIVLVALAFPKGLTATSIRGITSTVASMFCASAVGGRIDSANTKIRPLMFSISANHCAMISTYLVWMLWPTPNDQTPTNTTTLSFSGKVLFGVFLFLDVVEKLSAMANRLSIERDWIPSLVGQESIDMGYGLTQVNAVMKRVDVICKLVAPSLLPLIVSSIGSRVGWIMVLAISTVGIWILELCLAMNIARENKQLLATKARRYFDVNNLVEGGYSGSVRVSWLRKIYVTMYLETAARLKLYFSMAVWPASIASSFPQVTVLAYSATLITYLLEIGFSLSTITIARGFGTFLALGSTFITPWAVEYLRRRGNKGQGAVRRVGFWAVSSQFTMMIPVVLVLWNLSPASSNSTTVQPPHQMISVMLFVFLSFTRIGHWAFELMIQEIEQVEVPASYRSTFAGTEQSFHSLAELCHWAATVVWSRPEDFRWLALGSLIMIGTGATIYGSWSRKSKPTLNEASYTAVSLDDISEERRG